MQIGLMWYDDDPRKSLETKMEQAAARFHEKYGRAPNACYVSLALAASEKKHSGMRIVAARSIRPNYLWVGVDDP